MTNVLVGNDDDHLRNHGFLFDGKGWRLSPLYDVVPRPRVSREGRLVLSVGERGHEATLANALSAAPWFGLDRDDAAAMLEKMRRSVETRWRKRLAQAGVKAIDVKRLENCFVEAGRRDWR